MADEAPDDPVVPSLPIEGAEVLDEDELLGDLAPKGKGNTATLHTEAKQVGDRVRSAEAAAAAAIRMQPGLGEVIAELQEDETLAKLDEPVEFSDIVDNDTYAGLIQEMLLIVDRYRDGDIDFATSQQDVLKLGACLIYLSQKLGVFQAQVADLRSKAEKIRTTAYVRAKGMVTSKKSRVSDTDAKEVAKYFSLAAAERLTALEGVERYIFNMFMSLRTFQEMLNYVAGREAKVNLGPSLP